MIAVLVSLLWWWLIISIAVSLGLVVFTLFLAAADRWHDPGDVDWRARERERLR